ncbi:Smr/MutS family protein [Zeaxanthinibacter enoshimensis]|uniref:Smr domain-containing protein n=1 Tax=Zeaxanthinibacter enoshimensis TaxID=392009 RepID=A0A4R6TG17_9FLAO|nr:Smr/MutS family protein [Zeaxanthinibacter enoshimensis]TDQ29295.1 Smr domain-containing protein [Zeaxanthinibacter enoshimensis]
MSKYNSDGKGPTLRPGDRAEAIDDLISGTVTRIEGGVVTLLTDDGFPMNFEMRELVRISGETPIEISNSEISRVKDEEARSGKRRKPAPRPKERNAPQMEVDLHIEKLTQGYKRLETFEILELQLETAKRQLEFAIRKRIQKVVFIHGVGEGILKEELKYLFNRYEGVRFYDADYQKYGMGATEVYITQQA